MELANYQILKNSTRIYLGKIKLVAYSLIDMPVTHGSNLVTGVCELPNIIYPIEIPV